jgi:hypothetical protein
MFFDSIMLLYTKWKHALQEIIIKVLTHRTTEWVGSMKTRNKEPVPSEDITQHCNFWLRIPRWNQCHISFNVSLSTKNSTHKIDKSLHVGTRCYSCLVSELFKLNNRIRCIFKLVVTKILRYIFSVAQKKMQFQDSYSQPQSLFIQLSHLYCRLGPDILKWTYYNLFSSMYVSAVVHT